MSAQTTVDSVRQLLVDLKMASALEVLDSVLQRVERDEISTLEALDAVLAE